MADNDSRISEQVVSEFIRAMNDWEVDAYQRYKESIFDETDHAKILAASEKAGDERKGVIARYCTSRERYQAPFGHPPQYAPKHEKIIEVRKKTSKRVEVLTEYLYPEQYISQKRRYKVILTPEGWRIDNRTTELNGRWYSSI